MVVLLGRLTFGSIGLRLGRLSCGINGSDRSLPRVMYQSRIPMKSEKQAVHMPMTRKFWSESLGENLFWCIISIPRTMKKLWTAVNGRELSVIISKRRNALSSYSFSSSDSSWRVSVSSSISGISVMDCEKILLLQVMTSVKKIRNSNLIFDRFFKIQFSVSYCVDDKHTRSNTNCRICGVKSWPLVLR